MEIHKSRLALAIALLAIVVPQTFSAPATRATCAPAACRQSQGSALNYQEGKTYVYAFETEVLTQVLGSTEETSRIKVKGQASIAAQSACDLVLTLQQVAIQSPSGQAISKVDDIEGSSLRFAYQDGEIESLCVSEDDPTWSANVKRAVVSMLVNKAAANGSTSSIDTVETDVSGKCPVIYSVDGNKYTKNKNLNACTQRDGGVSISFGVPYESTSKHNSFSGIDSSLNCEQTVVDGAIQSVACVEHHRVEGLSTSKTGVHTQIKASLNLNSKVDGIQKGARVATKRSSVVFDHSEIQEVQRQKTSATRAISLLNKLCSEIESGTVSSKVPGLFMQLKGSLRSSRKDDLKEVYEQITSGKMCSKASTQLGKLFLDAAASAGTDGPIAFVAEVIANDQGEPRTREVFKMYATFAQQPGPSALEAVTTLISSNEAESDYLLVASGLAHQYCTKTNDDCASNNEYNALVDKIAQHVRTPTNEEETRKVVAALHALGNLDHLTPAAVSAISNLLTDSAANERIRVRALDAFRRDPCQADLKQKALKIFGDIKESSQVRIQAYRTIALCAADSDVPAVQSILDAEESNQVGSYVSSHIENSRETVLQTRKPKVAFFKQLTIPKTFHQDLRKFSRNLEYSSFSPDANLGLGAEGNLIFSQDSFIPRSLDANVTVEAYGNAYNLIEVGGYAEHLEEAVEKWLGPQGCVKQNSISGLISKGVEKFDQVVEAVKNRLKREVKTDANQNEIDAIREKVHMEERVGAAPRGDIYIRVFGTSIAVESFSAENLKDFSLTRRLKKGFEKLAEGLKETKVDLTEPFIFVDDEVTLPTSAGLPLNLQLEGTTVLSLQMSGNLDVARLLRAEGVADMRARVMPSAAAVLKAKMTVGTGPIESGLQLESKIHSASGVDLKIVREDGKFEVKFNIPQERTQIIDVRSDLYWVEQPQDSLQKKTPVTSTLSTRSLVDNQCTSLLSKALGIKLCMDAKIPKLNTEAPFPVLNGPVVLSLSLEKSEASMEGYYLKVQRDSSDPASFEYNMLLDTPGSRVNRKIAASFKGTNYKTATPEYQLKVESPWKKLDVEYQRSLTDELKGITLKIKSDDDEYSGKVQLKQVTSGNVLKYQPIVQYSLPGKSPVNIIEGQVVRVVGKKVEIDLKTAAYESLKGHIKGVAEITRRDEGGFEVIVKNMEFAADKGGKVIIDSTISRADRVVDAKVALKYGKTAEHTFELEGRAGMPSETKTILKTKVRSSRRSFLNFDIDWEVNKSDNTLDHKLEYTRGTSDPKVQLSVNGKVKLAAKNDFELVHELVFKHPQLNVDVSAKADAKVAPGQPRHAELSINANSLKADLKYESPGTELWDYTVTAQAAFAGKTFDFSEVAKKTGDKQQSFKTRVAVTPGFWVESLTDVGFKFEKQNVESFLNLKITSDKLDNPIVLKSGVRGKGNDWATLVKLDAKGKNLADFDGKVKIGSRTVPTTINIKANVPTYLEAKLAQSFSRSEGNFDLNIKWIPTGRRLSATSKRTSQGETFNIDADLKWDADRDATKAISLKSVTLLSTSAWRLDSKNDITLMGKTSKINVAGALARDIVNGESNIDATFVSSEGSTYNVASIVNLENKRKSKGGKVDLKVTLPNQQPYAIKYEGRVSNLDKTEMTFQILSDLQLDVKGEQDLEFKVEVGSTLPGNYRHLTAKTALSGSLLPEPLSGEIKADIKRGKVAVKGSANRGARNGDFDVVVDYDRWSPKKTIGIKYIVNTPIDRFRTVEGDLKYGYLFSSWKNFELTEQGNFLMNKERPIEWKRSTSVLNNEFKLSSELKNEGKAVFNLDADAKLTSSQFLTSVESTYKGEKSFLKVDVDYELPEAGITVRGGSPMLKTVGTKDTFEVKATLKKTGEVFETEVHAKTINDVDVRVVNKIEFTPAKKFFDIVVTASEEPSRRLKLVLNNEGNNKYNVEALVRWGDGGKFLSTKGDFSRTSEAFDASMILDSPELNANKFNVKVNRKSTAGRHGFKVKIEGNGEEQLSGDFDYARKEGRSGQKTYEGSVVMKSQMKGFLSLFNFDGKFTLEDSRLERATDNEEGRQIRADFELKKDGNPIVAHAVAKTSDKEKRVELSLCKNGNAVCRNADLHFRHQHESNGDLEYSLKLVAESKEAEAKTVRGLNIKTTKTDGGLKVEHTTMLILSGDREETVGYRLYRDSNEVGTEILLPQRVIALVLVGTNPTPGKVTGDISFYVDKTKQPERKISLVFSSAKENKSMRTAYARNVEITFKHPDLEKDLRVATSLGVGGESILLDVKTVLDVFKADSEIVLAYRVSKEEVSGGRAYNGQWSIKSKGQHINIGGESVLSQDDKQISYKHELHYENRERQLKTAKINAVFTLKSVDIEVDGPSSKLVILKGVAEETEIGWTVREEILLPGMESSRKIETNIRSVKPRSLQVKTFTSDSPAAIYYEAFIGFRDENLFAAGVYDHETNGKKILAETNVALKNNRILDIKSKWERRNVRNFVSKVQKRLVKTGENLQQITGTAVEEVAKEIRHVSSNMRKASPNLSAISTGTKTQWETLRSELDTHEDTKILVERFNILVGYAKRVGKVVVEMTRVVRKLAASVLKTIEAQIAAIPELLKQYSDRVPLTSEELQEFGETIMLNIMRAVSKGIKLFNETIDTISANMPKIIERINWILDITSDATKVLQDILETTLVEAAKVWKSVRGVIADILKNESVKAALKDILNYTQLVLRELIDQIKEQAESLKDTILSNVSQKDFQQAVEAIADYIEKKAKNIDVDDAAAIKEIVDKLIAVVKSAYKEIFSINVEEGSFFAAIPLPWKIVSLSDMSSFLEGISFRPKPIEYHIAPLNLRIREKINELRHGASLLDVLLPPFSGSALLVGSQYYKTWDGKFFRFDGNCQYLLASDMADGNFSIVVDYDKQGQAVQKSIIVTGSEHTVAIKPDSSVVVDGQTANIDSPVTAGPFTVEKKGDWVIVTGDQGVKVGCSSALDVCAAKVDGFYHGKVRGLLGEFNLEAFDDLSTPEGVITPNVFDLAQSWKIENECREQNIPVLHVIPDTVRSRCAAAFSSQSSSLSSCYDTVDPKEFQSICENLSVSAGFNEDNKGLCTASLGYAKACKMAYAPVDTVQECRSV